MVVRIPGDCQPNVVAKRGPSLKGLEVRVRIFHTVFLKKIRVASAPFFWLILPDLWGLGSLPAHGDLKKEMEPIENTSNHGVINELFVKVFRESGVLAYSRRLMTP